MPGGHWAGILKNSAHSQDVSGQTDLLSPLFIDYDAGLTRPANACTCAFCGAA